MLPSGPLDNLLVRLNPDAWQHGFSLARPWRTYLAAPGQAEALAEMVRLSLWPACGWPSYEPFPEGFMVGLYGDVYSDAITAGLGPRRPLT